MSYLSIENLCSQVDSFKLDDINIKIDKNEYFVLLGQSGSGKTRLLETIAGLNKSSGKIFYKDEDISVKNPEDRDIGFVYQDFALFPNLSVKENIIFSGRYKKINKADEHLEDIVSFLKIQNLLERSTTELSGGEKQRVAIARALYSKPKILLLDEPLSAIDPTFRNSILKSLKEIHKRFDLTTLHVTHNFREASYLADKIAIIMDGKIHQIGSADEVLNHPVNIDVAKFLGFKNIFPTTLLKEKVDKAFFSVDPNVIFVGSGEIQKDYVFEGVIEECMGIVDHYKLFVNVQEQHFFIKVLKRDYDKCYADAQKLIKIGFDKQDVSYL